MKTLPVLALSCRTVLDPLNMLMVGHTFTDRRNVNMQTNTESEQEREIKKNVFTLYRDKKTSDLWDLGYLANNHNINLRISQTGLNITQKPFLGFVDRTLFASSHSAK